MVIKNNGLIDSVKRGVSRVSKKLGLNLSKPELSEYAIPRSRHCISRSNISKNALTVLYGLKSADYTAYLVGGSVRDLLMKRKPKDFDIATDATPEQVRSVFRNSRIIGRRFLIVHVYFKDEIIEVSTFRAKSDVNGDEPVTMIKADNVYGTIEEDVWRRDFTVNALYYGVNDFAVLDYTGGMDDLKARCIRMIGDPVQRFHEDPVRLLRAIRFSAKLGFDIDPEMEKQIRELVHLLKNVPQARLMDEVAKLFFEGNASVTYKCLEKMNYVAAIFPELAQVLAASLNSASSKLISEVLAVTDKRFHNQQRLTQGFLLAAFLWPVVQKHLQDLQQKGVKFFIAFHQAMNDAVDNQSKVFMITRRMVAMIHSVWTLQYHLERRCPQRVFHLLKQRFFRAAFDLLMLRAQIGEVSMDLAVWWQEIQVANSEKQAAMIAAISKVK